jgi:hypothetical protein
LQDIVAGDEIAGIVNAGRIRAQLKSETVVAIRDGDFSAGDGRALRIGDDAGDASGSGGRLCESRSPPDEQNRQQKKYDEYETNNAQGTPSKYGVSRRPVGVAESLSIFEKSQGQAKHLFGL